MQLNFSLNAALWVAWLNIIYAAPVPVAEPTTIVAFGDSTTAHRDATKVYATILQEELQNVRVLNAGVRGNTTEMARKRFEKDVLENQPQIAIIQFGINDAAVDVWKTPPATTPRVSLERYEENLRFFAKALKLHHTRVVMMTPNPICWTPKLRDMYGKPPYQPDDADGFNTLMIPYCEAVRRAALEESVEFWTCSRRSPRGRGSLEFPLMHFFPTACILMIRGIVLKQSCYLIRCVVGEAFKKTLIRTT